MSGRAPGFSTGSNGTLARAGLTGITTRVILDGDRLVLTGATTERLEIAASDVARLRLAEFPASARTQGFCEAAIDRPGGAILLTANREDVAYAATMRAFARVVAAARGIEALRTGPGLVSAIILLLLVMGSLSFLAAFLLFLAITGGGWWWAPALLFAPLYLIAWRAQLRRQWPRRVRGLADLDPVLPPFTGAHS